MLGLRRRGRSSRCRDLERCRREILDIVEFMPSLNKAAFYGDPTVEDVLGRLHRRWEENGRAGEPIDYADSNELEQLLELARHYAGMPVWKAYRMFLERSGA
jgi:hypothetical protein